MNNTVKKLIQSENRVFLTIMAIFTGALILSALIYTLTGRGTIGSINYEAISQMTLMQIFFMTLKRNIIYFLAVILLTWLGQGRLTRVLFGFPPCLRHSPIWSFPGPGLSDRLSFFPKLRP
jgi:hypothetical protein